MRLEYSSKGNDTLSYHTPYGDIGHPSFAVSRHLLYRHSPRPEPDISHPEPDRFITPQQHNKLTYNNKLLLALFWHLSLHNKTMHMTYKQQTMPGNFHRHITGVHRIVPVIRLISVDGCLFTQYF